MNFMERGIILMLVFVCFFGGVFGEGNWDEVSVDGEIVDVEDSEDGGNLDYSVGESNEVVSKKGKFFTQDFYIAIGLVILVLFIVLFLVWALLNGPKNKWE
jgi:hypothetical protein